MRKAKLIIVLLSIVLSIVSCTGTRKYYNTGVTNGCMGRKSGLIGYN
jgi:hypothetical protein